MRFDSQGLFWEDVEEVKPERKAQVEKRQPPERTWELPNYLPGLEHAQSFDVALFDDPTGQDLINASLAREKFVFDCEVYPNYFLVCFRSVVSKQVVYFEMFDGCALDIPKLRWVLLNFCIIGFNSRAFDVPILQLALAGATCEQLKDASDSIIKDDVRAWDILKKWKIEEANYNHIDLIEVAPLNGSLKIYGGRLHCKRMWDLPFAPDSLLSHEQMLITRWYCLNDLDQTELLFESLSEQIELRERMGYEINKDLRSLSDAQIAETVISHELKKLGVYPKKQDVQEGTVYRYQPPDFINFATSYMQEIYSRIQTFDFVVGDDGYVKQPAELETLKIKIGGSEYQMGMGGLHSCEVKAIHKASQDVRLFDRDVASYYPRIILNCRLFPEHLGEVFLEVYGKLVQKRLQAKAAGNKIEADSLKITVNGVFGKLGSKWSFMYAPNLLFQVTLTGQLSLLMLIEQLELAGILVVSANTDGIVFKFPVELETAHQTVINWWQTTTGFETDCVEYTALYSRDVNNYIAVKKNGSTKNKGAFANPWKDYNSIFRLHKNPTTTVCIEAVENYLINGVPLADTIRACTDMRKFISIRHVKGGAVKDGIYLGKAIRWYYAVDAGSEIIYATTGNRVAKSEGALPIMTLPYDLPENIDYGWYERECQKILIELGAGVDS